MRSEGPTRVLIPAGGGLVDQMVTGCRHLDWPLIDVFEPEGRAPRALEFRPGGLDAVVLLLLDSNVGIPRLLVQGSDAGEVVDQLQHHVDVASDDSLLQAWTDADDEEQQVDSILRLGLGSPDPIHRGYVRCLLEALRSELASVRHAAVFGIAHRPWSVFEGPLREALAREEEVSILHDIREVLRDWDAKVLEAP